MFGFNDPEGLLHLKSFYDSIIVMNGEYPANQRTFFVDSHVEIWSSERLAECDVLL